MKKFNYGNMMERVFTKWTVIRVLFLFLGIYVIVHSILNKEWIGVAFGGYFASMGLFAFGCAGGACFGAACSLPSEEMKKTNREDIEFEELGRG